MANGRRKMNTVERNEEDYRTSYLSSTTLKWAVSLTMDLRGNEVGKIAERKQTHLFGNFDEGTDSGLAMK